MWHSIHLLRIEVLTVGLAMLLAVPALLTTAESLWREVVNRRAD